MDNALFAVFGSVVPEKHGGIVGAGSKALLSIFRGKKLREKIWRTAEKHMIKYRLVKTSV